MAWPGSARLLLSFSTFPVRHPVRSPCSLPTQQRVPFSDKCSVFSHFAAHCGFCNVLHFQSEWRIFAVVGARQCISGRVACISLVQGCAWSDRVGFSWLATWICSCIFTSNLMLWVTVWLFCMRFWMTLSEINQISLWQHIGRAFLHIHSHTLVQLINLVRFESSQFQVPLLFNVVLDDMAVKTCTGVALNCIAFGVPPSLPHPFLPPFDS